LRGGKKRKKIVSQCLAALLGWETAWELRVPLGHQNQGN
jgi:hypothetical protein